MTENTQSHQVAKFRVKQLDQPAGMLSVNSMQQMFKISSHELSRCVEMASPLSDNFNYLFVVNSKERFVTGIHIR